MYFKAAVLVALATVAPAASDNKCLFSFFHHPSNKIFFYFVVCTTYVFIYCFLICYTLYLSEKKSTAYIYLYIYI